MNGLPVNLREYEGFEEQVPFDCSDGRGGYVLVGPTGNPLRVSSSAYNLLLAVRNGMSFSTLAKVLQFSPGESTGSVDRLECACEEIFKKLDDIQQRSARARLPWGFWIRLPLVPQELVVRIASFVSFFYEPVVALLVIACIMIMTIRAAHDGLNLNLGQASILPGYFLFLLSLIFHEFGHAAACARYKARPSDIGFAIYLIYPAFYSNVSSCWKLNRWKRVIVDLGGSYFQLAYGAGLLAAYYVTHWLPLKVGFVMILYMSIFCLNPIFRFDGYWILADALGVPNLSRQPSLIMNHFKQRLLRRPTDRLPWTAPVITVLAVYTLVSNVVWAQFILKLLPALLSNLHRLYLLARGMFSEIIVAKLPSSSEWYGIAVSLYFSAILCVMAYHFGVLIGGILKRRFKKANTKTSIASALPAGR
jgi:putative peptide zinc metalloprotease protein